MNIPAFIRSFVFFVPFVVDFTGFIVTDMSDYSS